MGAERPVTEARRVPQDDRAAVRPRPADGVDDDAVRHGDRRHGRGSGQRTAGGEQRGGRAGEGEREHRSGEECDPRHGRIMGRSP